MVTRQQRDRQSRMDEVTLALCFCGLVGLVVLLSLIHLSIVGRFLYLIAALVFGWVSLRRSPWLFLSASLWFWLFTAFVRRMLEWRTGFNPADFVLVAPDLMLLLLLPQVINSPGLFQRRGIGYVLLLLGCVSFGLFVSFFRGDILAGLLASTDWIAPLLYLFLFLCNADRIDEAEAHFGAFLTFSSSLLIPYSVWQYLKMPDWDIVWMLGANMGDLSPQTTKVFGTLNNPGALAIWAGTLVVWLAYFRGKVLLLLSPFIVFVVGISLVRGIYGSMLGAIILGALLGRGHFKQLLVLLAACIFLGGTVAGAVYPEAVEKIVKRAMTVQDLQADDSAQVRAMIWSAAPGLIADNPFGTGIGSQGRGGAASGPGPNGAAPVTVNIDFGPLSVYMGLGWVAGTIYIIGLGLITLHAISVGRRRNSALAATMGAAAICPLGIFPLVNIISFPGVVMWICVGYALALDMGAAPERSVGIRPAVAARLAR
jgi:hypothetical protein